MNSVASCIFQPPIVTIFRQVGGYTLYNTVGLHICYVFVNFFVMNHQCLVMKHLKFSHKTLKFLSIAVISTDDLPF